MKMQLPSDEQHLVVDSFRTFLLSEVAPIVRVFRDRPIPQGNLREITQGIAEFGLPGASLAKEFGGMGLSTVTEAMLFEELCSVSVEIAACVMANLAVVAALAELPEARAHLRERYLPDLLAGRSFAGFCMGEVDAGGVTANWDLDSFVIEGEQGGVSNGHLCDFLIAPVRLASGASCHLLVDRSEHGYQALGVERSGVGRACGAQVAFVGGRLPASQLFWDEDEGSEARARLLEKVHAGSGLLAVGLMRVGLEAFILAAQESAGGDQPLAAQPLVAARIADLATRLEAARLLCIRAFSMIGAGIRCQMQASMAQWFATEMALETCRTTVLLQERPGPVGALDVERLLREVMTLPVASCGSDFHKLLIARELTGISALA
ncbi:acyl-CoA dehydrogenase family protein [Pseudomonas sp. BN515]|uniref:acyl-CoA dehydrogenase family protein n=1 Tax=Pseudomonas sp. BN515 TaxID=2567892 RepID=UPI002456F8AD|nr:acyl-CoA dehydrogenase family protein [Pseudomonas sp. BN515]MDH4873577.1 acyl-CoA dehydrogenase [Pseudomonas sp. BN515]